MLNRVLRLVSGDFPNSRRTHCTVTSYINFIPVGHFGGQVVDCSIAVCSMIVD